MKLATIIHELKIRLEATKDEIQKGGKFEDIKILMEVVKDLDTAILCLRDADKNLREEPVYGLKPYWNEDEYSTEEAD